MGRKKPQKTVRKDEKDKNAWDEFQRVVASKGNEVNLLVRARLKRSGEDILQYTIDVLQNEIERVMGNKEMTQERLDEFNKLVVEVDAITIRLDELKDKNNTELVDKDRISILYERVKTMGQELKNQKLQIEEDIEKKKKPSKRDVGTQTVHYTWRQRSRMMYCN
ncbi:unnamed protein product [Caenorhabditis brenneri]